MSTEYNPAESQENAAIASPAVTPVAPESLGDGGIKALNSEREQRKALEKQTKQLEQMLAESKKALEQSQLSLEEKYRQETEQYKAGLLTEAQKAIAERDAKLQELMEARQTAEQRAEVLENQRAIAKISTEFNDTFSSILVNPKKIDAYMAQISDDLAVDSQGNPALIARRDANGQPVELAPISAAIAYFQQLYPEDFKPPAEQKTGGGYRNLANSSDSLPSRQSQGTPLKLSIQDINDNPQAFLANRDRIAKGDFSTK
jgi:hypothetical protein